MPTVKKKKKKPLQLSRRTIPNDFTDTGIFTLAKQCHGIDFCDCDEFGIVI